MVCFRWLILFGFMFWVAGCRQHGAEVTEIKLNPHHHNALQVQVDVLTDQNASVYAEYWPDSSETGEKYRSIVSPEGKSHSVVLYNLLPHKAYSYRIVTISNGKQQESQVYHFQSQDLPPWLQDQFKSVSSVPQLLPKEFTTGYMLMNKRETPGLVYLVDTKGRIRWYHMVDGTGFKVSHFTADTTIISILGTNDEPTSYGSEIMELNLAGDTLLHLKKGMGDFPQQVHHEVLKKNSNEIITLFVDKRIMDLTAVGGSKKDTVNGDGIMIMDRKGKELWQWSVFDVMNPFDDHQLLQHKKDWMHANSLNFDKDSNLLISFYNNGQIWKIDAHTGKVLWKLGKGGTLSMPQGADFSMAHSVHINPKGDLMFFDNGTDRHQSEVFAFKINDAAKSAQTTLHVALPQDIYNDRMGSAYMINDTTVLCCSSKRHIAVLANTKGTLLWTLETAIPPYRVQFIPAGWLRQYIKD